MLLKPSSITNARDDDDAEGDLQDQTYILGATIETRHLLTSLRDMLAGSLSSIIGCHYSEWPGEVVLPDMGMLRRPVV